ncbi:MAG: hypothetical protein ACP5I6_05115 [Caldisphaera sp.]|jgi:fructose-1-phosphate kinase PfkB-like protein|nr:MAG: hypothetical protein C0201_04055 [Caldisphaera sp.]PMP92073.1 MAG: hypothetical protein C0171_01475 [Caldisphaera sp.]
MCKAIIISSPTIDVIEINEKRITSAGGPPLFMGFALKKIGCDVNFYGPIGKKTMKTVKLQEKIGVKTLGEQQENEGAIFLHKYDNGKRFTLFTGNIKSINVGNLVNIINKMENDFIIVSPINNEYPIDKLSILKKPLVLDSQGYSRTIKEWYNKLPDSYLDLMHLSNDDEPESILNRLKNKSEYILYTVGLKNTIIINKEKIIKIKPKGNPVKDMTGAGDIITGLVSYFLFYKKYDIKLSYAQSEELFEEIINEISEIKLKVNEVQ